MKTERERKTGRKERKGEKFKPIFLAHLEEHFLKRVSHIAVDFSIYSPRSGFGESFL